MISILVLELEMSVLLIVNLYFYRTSSEQIGVGHFWKPDLVLWDEPNVEFQDKVVVVDSIATWPFLWSLSLLELVVAIVIPISLRQFLNLTLPNNCNLIPLGHGTRHESISLPEVRLEPTTFQSKAERSTYWATDAFFLLLQKNECPPLCLDLQKNKKCFVFLLSGPNGTSNFHHQSLIHSDLNYTTLQGPK